MGSGWVGVLTFVPLYGELDEKPIVTLVAAEDM